jgi:crossover junction endodeoxyribonuclease RuvC
MSKGLWTLGIDPGLSGALALLDGGGALIDVRDMPVRVERKSDGGERRRVDAVGLCGTVRDMLGEAQRSLIGVWIEAVSASPRDGVTQAFSFGHGLGTVDAVLALEGLAGRPIAASRWKGAFRLGRDKGASRDLASRLFPDHAAAFARACDDGRAEAALIARFGWQIGLTST